MKWRITTKMDDEDEKHAPISFHMHGRIVESFISCRHIIEEEILLW
jgi:hypothetical protein